MISQNKTNLFHTYKKYNVNLTKKNMAMFEDNDYYGAECEMDDQLLIVNEDSDHDGDNLLVNDYERDFLEKQAEYMFGNENISEQVFQSVKKSSRNSSRQSSMTSVVPQDLRNRTNSNNMEDSDEILPPKIPNIATTTTATTTLYPPERRPPIFDFFTVLTAFIVAVILAYYTISSY